MPKIKILHIVKSLGRGGAEMLLQEVLEEHDLNVFEFHFIYFLPWKNQMVAGIEANGGIVKIFPATNNIRIITQVPKIIDYIKKNEIKLVHCHLPWAGFAGRLIYKLHNVPVMYTEHNIQDRYHFITKFLNKITFNWQTKVIAVSNDVAESIQKTIHPKIPVQIILNGVNTRTFVRNAEDRITKRKELGLKEDDIFIGVIAVFRFQKRLKEWIELFKAIHEKHPNLKGCIVGDGILKNEIMAHLKEMGMENHIIFPGLQPNVKPWISAFDIFMMTSSFEGLPIALLEAMSMECAIVSTDAGGIKEVIRPGIDGFTSPVAEWKQLENHLEYLITDKSALKQFSSQSRLRVQEAFSLKKMVLETEAAYCEILKK